jgi:hypothetical protein
MWTGIGDSPRLTEEFNQMIAVRARLTAPSVDLNPVTSSADLFHPLFKQFQNPPKQFFFFFFGE